MSLRHDFDDGDIFPAGKFHGFLAAGLIDSHRGDGLRLDLGQGLFVALLAIDDINRSLRGDFRGIRIGVRLAVDGDDCLTISNTHSFAISGGLDLNYFRLPAIGPDHVQPYGLAIRVAFGDNYFVVAYRLAMS